jgi:hypothetical protein
MGRGGDVYHLDAINNVLLINPEEWVQVPHCKTSGTSGIGAQQRC